MIPAVIVFAKQPKAGLVKTRLIPLLGPEGAAELYECFLMDSLVQTYRIVQNLETHLFIQITPESTVTYFEDLCESLGFDGKFVDVGLQNGEELGERLARSFDIVLSNNEGGAVVMGTDHPTLPDSVITVAIQSLDRCDVVLGPAEDGGYYLVGLNRPRPELFRDIPWSTSDVFESTLRRLTGEKVKVLPAWYDVDTPKDLERLLKELQESRDQSYTKKCLADLLPEKNHGQ